MTKKNSCGSGMERRERSPPKCGTKNEHVNARHALNANPTLSCKVQLEDSGKKSRTRNKADVAEKLGIHGSHESLCATCSDPEYPH